MAKRKARLNKRGRERYLRRRDADEYPLMSNSTQTAWQATRALERRAAREHWDPPSDQQRAEIMAKQILDATTASNPSDRGRAARTVAVLMGQNLREREVQVRERRGDPAPVGLVAPELEGVATPDVAATTPDVAALEGAPIVAAAAASASAEVHLHVDDISALIADEEAGAMGPAEHLALLEFVKLQKLRHNQQKG